MLVSERLIDEMSREPWRPPLYKKVAGHSSTEPGEYEYDVESVPPEPGSADEVRQLVASRVVLLHSERLISREAMIVLAEEHQLAWLLDRWMPGLLSDWKRVAPRIVRLVELIDSLRRPCSADRRTPSDPSRRRQLRDELMDIDRRLVGLTLLTDRPELVVCGGATVETAAVEEAERAGVKWLAPEAVDDEAVLRLMRCVAQCATAAREDASGRARPTQQKLVDPMAPRGDSFLFDPSQIRSC